MKTLLFPMAIPLAAETNFHIGQCAIVKPNRYPSPRGDFFVGKVGQVTEFLTDHDAVDLRSSRKNLSAILHFMEEPADWKGFGQGYLPSMLQSVPCPKGFKLAPYGFDLQPVVDRLEKLNDLLEKLK